MEFTKSLDIDNRTLGLGKGEIKNIRSRVSMKEKEEEEK